jgi:prepilin-type N-terminal cleavage/methylation domain-containing protein
MSRHKFNIKKSLPGFTLVELAVTMGIFATLVGISSISLFNLQHRGTLNSSVSTFVADLKATQLRAMVGDTGSGSGSSNYGIRLQANSYTTFRDTYGTENVVFNLPTVLEFTYPGYEIIFLNGSGEIQSGSGTVVIRDETSGKQKSVNLNRYGIVTSVN